MFHTGFANKDTLHIITVNVMHMLVRCASFGRFDRIINCSSKGWLEERILTSRYHSYQIGSNFSKMKVAKEKEYRIHRDYDFEFCKCVCSANYCNDS